MRTLLQRLCLILLCVIWGGIGNAAANDPLGLFDNGDGFGPYDSQFKQYVGAGYVISAAPSEYISYDPTQWAIFQATLPVRVQSRNTVGAVPASPLTQADLIGLRGQLQGAGTDTLHSLGLLLGTPVHGSIALDIAAGGGGGGGPTLAQITDALQGNGFTDTLHSLAVALGPLGGVNGGTVAGVSDVAGSQKTITDAIAALGTVAVQGDVTAARDLIRGVGNPSIADVITAVGKIGGGGGGPSLAHFDAVVGDPTNATNNAGGTLATQIGFTSAQNAGGGATGLYAPIGDPTFGGTTAAGASLASAIGDPTYATNNAGGTLASQIGATAAQSNTAASSGLYALVGSATSAAGGTPGGLYAVVAPIGDPTNATNNAGGTLATQIGFTSAQNAAGGATGLYAQIAALGTGGGDPSGLSNLIGQGTFATNNTGGTAGTPSLAALLGTPPAGFTFADLIGYQSNMGGFTAGGTGLYAVLGRGSYTSGATYDTIWDLLVAIAIKVGV